MIGVYQGVVQVAVSKPHSVNPPQGHLWLWPEQSRLCGLKTTRVTARWHHNIVRHVARWWAGKQLSFSLGSQSSGSSVKNTIRGIFMCCHLLAGGCRLWNLIWATSVYINVFLMKLVFPPLWLWLYVSREQCLIWLHFFSPNRALNYLQSSLLFKQNINNTPNISYCTIIFCIILLKTLFCLTWAAYATTSRREKHYKRKQLIKNASQQTNPAVSTCFIRWPTFTVCVNTCCGCKDVR